jgi:predicted Rossmann fold flavoprotein
VASKVTKTKAYDLIIIGAGASGLMAAGRFHDRKTLLLEGAPQPAQKIKISGGGRCNITNKIVTPDHYVGDKSFVETILRGFDQHALLTWCKVRGLAPIVRKERQYFCPKSAQELIDILLREIKGVTLRCNRRVQHVAKEGIHFRIETDRDTFFAKELVVASGGLSFPKIGATDIAFKIAETFGHTVVTPKPALVGLTLQKEQFWMKALSGIALPVSIKVADKKVAGDLLFAHRGISGPAVLNTSLYWDKGEIEIDFLPHFKLDDSLFRGRKNISTALKLPKRFIKAFLDAIGLEDKALHLLTSQERTRLKSLHAYRFAPAGNFGFSKAEVTRGGISTQEIDKESMMSKKCEGLYFLGEALDVTGELGGYNFQWAFATAQRLQLNS